MPTPSAGRRPVACGSPMRDPARGAHGAAPLGRAGGQAPLPGFPASPRPGPALCGDPARAVAGAGRLAGRRVQVRAARPLDRPGAGAAVPASGPERGQHPVFGARGARCGAGPRPVLSRGADPPALPRPVSVHGHGIPGPGPSGIRNCTAAPCTGPRAGTARAPPGARPRQRRLHRPAWKAGADAGAAPAPRRPPPSGAPRPPAAGCGAAGRSRPGSARPRDDAPAPRRTGGHPGLAEGAGRRAHGRPHAHGDRPGHARRHEGLQRRRAVRKGAVAGGTGGHRCLAEQKDRSFRTAGQVDDPQGVGGGGPRGTAGCAWAMVGNRETDRAGARGGRQAHPGRQPERRGTPGTVAPGDHATGAPVGVPGHGDDGGEPAAMHGLPDGATSAAGPSHPVPCTRCAPPRARAPNERARPVCSPAGPARRKPAHTRPHRPGTGRAMRRGCGQGARPDRTALDRCPDPRSRNGHLARDPPGRARAAPAGERPAGRRGETGHRDLPLHNAARRGGRLPAGPSGPDRGHWAVESPTTACATRFPTGTPAGPAPGTVRPTAPARTRSRRPRCSPAAAGTGASPKPCAACSPPAGTRSGRSATRHRHPPNSPPPFFSIENTSRRRRGATRCDGPGHPG